MARKRRSRENEFLIMLFELSGVFWQLGAAVTTVFIFLSILSFRWARHSIAAAENSPYLAQVAVNYGWMLFALPVLFLSLSLIFSKKALDGYLGNGHY